MLFPSSTSWTILTYQGKATSPSPKTSPRDIVDFRRSHRRVHSYHTITSGKVGYENHEVGFLGSTHLSVSVKGVVYWGIKRF